MATNDLLQVSSAVTFAGTLIVTNIGTNALVTGDSFKLFNAGTYTGSFTKFILPALATGLYWNTNTLATNGTLTVRWRANAGPTYITGSNGAISGVTQSNGELRQLAVAP